MKLPSIKLLAIDTFSVFKRFPIEVLSTLTGTIAATISIRLSHYNYDYDTSFYVRLIMLSSLALLLNLSATLYTESKVITGLKKWLWHLVACCIIVVLFFMLNPYVHGLAHVIRFGLLSLSFHLLVSFAAFIGTKNINGFWQFNKVLFLRFLSSFLYGVVLYLGLAAALGSMNFLFNTKFDSETFSTLWVWVTGVFITMFFLAGVPPNVNELENDTGYPKGLKIFTQYVLIPLATVYVLILLSYEVKILITWRLPKGMVSDMILGYAVFGILSLLLVFPIRNMEENKWLKTFARSFYFLMIPLIVLLFLAVGTRIFKYGITEYRYFLILLSCWLFLITVYFLLSKKQNIKVIPVSLCVMTLFTIYGPQSAFSVSEFSQKRVLVNIFKKYGAFNDGKLQSLKLKKVSSKDGIQAVSTLEYLIDNHEWDCLQPYFKVNLSSISDSLSMEKDDNGKSKKLVRYQITYKQLEWAKAKLGLSRFEWNRYSSTQADTTANDMQTFDLHVQHEDVADVRGYDYTINQNYYENDTTVNVYAGIKFVQSSDKEKNTITLKLNSDIAAFNLTPFLKQLAADKKLADYKKTGVGMSQNYVLPRELLSMSDTTKKFIVTFRITNAEFSVNNGEVIPVSINGAYFIKARP